MLDLTMHTLQATLTELFEFSTTAAETLITQYGELAVQTHATYCYYLMQKGRVHTPPAWITASLKGDWNAPQGMPADWKPTVLQFRVDETTFIKFSREQREEQKEKRNV